MTRMLTAVLALALAGCTTNSLRLDRATSLGVAGKAASDGAAAMLKQVDSSNRALVIELATLDPGCTLPSPRIIKPGAVAKPGQICGTDDTTTFAFTRIGQRQFAPTLAVIEGLSAYLGGIDAIVTGKPVDLFASFNDAQAQLYGVLGDAATIAGTSAPLTGDQEKAITDTLALLSTLASESDKVRRLQALDATTIAAFDNSVAMLERRTGMWATVLVLQSGNLGSYGSIAADRLAAMKPPATPDTVRAARTRQMDALEGVAAAERLQAGLVSTIDALKKAHASYLDLLRNPDAARTDAEKIRERALAEQRLRAALHSLATLVAAF